MRNDCETCVNYVYDEDCEESICTVNLDEDELVRFMEDSHYCCPYYRLDDEYACCEVHVMHREREEKTENGTYNTLLSGKG